MSELVQDHHGDNQAVNGDPFGQTKEDQRLAHKFRLFGNGAYACGTDTADSIAAPDACQSDG
jgi:hypothetical protein